MGYHAKNMKIPRERADRLVAELRERAERFSNECIVLNGVDLFGSYIRREVPVLGDIDVVVDYALTPAFSAYSRRGTSALLNAAPEAFRPWAAKSYWNTLAWPVKVLMTELRGGRKEFSFSTVDGVEPTWPRTSLYRRNERSHK